MKKIYCICTFIALLFCLNSCKVDNYDGPDAGISGQILDQNGVPLQLEQGSSSMRIKLEELSWQDANPTASITPQYLNLKQDGSFINTKLFSGRYKMTPIEGPFFPYNVAGDTVQLAGSIVKNFTVVPYLEVSWVTAPSLDNSNYIVASVKFKRNSVSGVTAPDVKNARLCISTTQYVGNNNYDSQLISGTVTVTNSQEGQTLSFKTSRAVKYLHTSYYVRVGICCSDTYKKYNYTNIKQVDVP
jgi:hypothetical protein